MTKQLKDDMVLAVQQWLNKTYGGVSGYEKAPENGKTGWPTIYSLREGLQHELGISPVASGFGPATEAALKKMIGEIKVDYKGNIAKLIQGAFWCKGISPEDFSTEFTTKTKAAVISMQKDAGLSGDGVVTVPFMKALFDMMAFSLVPGGDKHIRNMQQTLNHDYNAYFGILPCDGIYQRDTNTALIYALQAEEGMDPNTANGVYGPGTIAKTPTVNLGAQGKVVRLIQWDLYVNGFNQNAEFNSNFDSYTANEVESFRKFMVLTPYSSTADLTVIKGLLTSNGNTSRDSIACDTATQLNLSQIQALKGIGFSKIGRYLTGTVGSGSTERNKFLTSDEINNLVDNDFSIFPLYEDGGYKKDYFTGNQGITDGYIAGDAAESLGFAENSVIYFAVDVDFLDGEIDSTVIPYIKSVNSILKTYGFKTGIYGTRNVCLHAQKNGINHFFVANMSTGWSGNLGFKMPEDWCFDQFVEYTYAGIDIDQVAASGRDSGCKTFNTDDNESVDAVTHKLVKSMPLLSPFGNTKFEFDHTYGPYTMPGLDLWATVKSSWSKQDNKSSSFTVTNGKLESSFKDDVADLMQIIYGEFNYLNALGLMNRMAKKVQKGTLILGIATRPEEPEQIGLKITYNGTCKKGNQTVEVSDIFEFYYKQIGNSPYPEEVYEPRYKYMNQPDFNWADLRAANYIMNVVSAFTRDAEEDLPVAEKWLPLLSLLLAE